MLAAVVLASRGVLAWSAGEATAPAAATLVPGVEPADAFAAAVGVPSLLAPKDGEDETCHDRVSRATRTQYRVAGLILRSCRARPLEPQIRHLDFFPEQPWRSTLRPC